MTIIKTYSLIVTIGTIWFSCYATTKPSVSRGMMLLGASFILMGVPTMSLLLYCAAAGKWDGVFFLCAIISAFVTAAAIGFNAARLFVYDQFETAFCAGIVGILIAGAPLAAYMLP